MKKKHVDISQKKLYAPFLIYNDHRVQLDKESFFWNVSHLQKMDTDSSKNESKSTYFILLLFIVSYFGVFLSISAF